MSTHQVATWAEWAGWKQEVPSRLPRAACLNGRQLRPTIDDNRGDWEHQGGKLEQHPPKWRSATSWPQRRQKTNQLTNEQQLKPHFPHKILPPGFVFCFQFKVRIWFKGHFTNRIYCQGIYYVRVCDCMFSCVHFLIKRRSCLQHISSAGSNIPNSCFWCQIFSRNFNLVRIPGWAETGIVGLRRAQVTSPGLPLNLF